MGDAAKDGKLSDLFKSQIPIWIDAGYRIDENLFAGIAQLKEDCPDGADCSASDIRFGLQGQYHLSPAESMDPWLGVGIGYEMAKSKTSGGGQEVVNKISGFEFLNLQGGLDFQASEGLGVGPFLSLSVGQYSKYKKEAPEILGGNSDGDIEDKGIHEWLLIGVRGSFQL